MDASPATDPSTVDAPSHEGANRVRVGTPTRKILLVKRDKIGDLLLATPVLSHLRAAMPSARIDVLANDYNAWVVKDHPAIDRLWVYRRSRHAGRLRPGAVIGQASQWFALAAARYDVAVVLNGEQSTRGIQRALSLRARDTIAYVEPGARVPSRLTIPLTAPSVGHEVERMLALCTEPLGIAAPPAVAHPRYALPRQEQDDAHAWLGAQGIQPGTYVVIGVGSRYPQTQPLPAQIVRWAQELKGRWNCQTLLQYTPGEAEGVAYPGSESIAHATMALGSTWIRLLPTTLSRVIGLLFNARTSILPDGGLMHFAAASPGGVLGLFAGDSTGSFASRWGPRGPRVAVVKATSSIHSVPDDAVFAKLESLLAFHSNPRLET